MCGHEVPSLQLREKHAESREEVVLILILVTPTAHKEW